MMRSFDEIVQIVTHLQREAGPVMLKMKDVLDRYDGDWILPMPSIADEPKLPPLTPALIGEAVDSMAAKAASSTPQVTCPAINADKDTGKGSRQFARKREEILAATYHHSKWPLGRRRYFRQLAAYHTGSLVVLPNFRDGLPYIEVRDPLGTYVEPQANEQLRAPEYVAYLTRHSNEYLRKTWPQCRQEVGGPVGKSTHGVELWDCVEWYDQDQICYGIVGPVMGTQVLTNQFTSTPPYLRLSPQFPNKLDMIPAVVPHNVSLGRIASRIASMIGNVDLQAKLMALNIVAQEKAIFPDMYAIGKQSGLPGVVGNRWKDGREGEMNFLQDVDSIGMLRSTPDQMTSTMIDRMERNFRVSVGLTPATGGENQSNLRTGRALDSLNGLAIDHRIQELHEIDEAWMPHLNAAIFATYQAYWPDKKFTLFSGWSGARSRTEFTPDTHIETRENMISYAVAGADVVQQTQILGSLLGTGSISRRTFRDRHPWIPDPEAEGALVDEEQFEDALKQAIMQQITQGALPVMVAVKIRNHMQKGHDIFAAVEQAEKEAKELQATAAPEPGPEQMMSPEAMPGLAAGPAALQQPMAEPPPQVEVPGDVTRMRQLMRTMRS